LEKVKKNWSHELKCASTTTKIKVAKVRAELKPLAQQMYTYLLHQRSGNFLAKGAMKPTYF